MADTLFGWVLRTQVPSTGTAFVGSGTGYGVRLVGSRITHGRDTLESGDVDGFEDGAGLVRLDRLRAGRFGESLRSLVVFSPGRGE